MYRDRSRVRTKEVKIRLNEYENQFVEDVLEKTGEQKAEFLRILALEGLANRLRNNNKQVAAA